MFKEGLIFYRLSLSLFLHLSFSIYFININNINIDLLYLICLQITIQRSNIKKK